MTSEVDRIAQVWPGWRTEELIGRGGFGSVYRVSRTVANHTSTGAVKIIDVPSDASDIKELRSMGMDDASIRDYFGQAARSLMSEIAAMDSLKGSANIVQIEDYQLREQKDGPGWTVFIRMELLESLEAYQERVGLPSQWETVRIGSQICNALARCHAIGIIHRDVKPANIFRNKFGDYKLGDFGIAKNLDNATRSTMTFAGTRPFMAPEVESGHYDGSVDTYSLGIMLYRWLNGGRPPFVGPDEVPTQAVLARAQARRFAGQRPPLPAGPSTDSELATLVTKACEPEPANRWASAEEFGQALQSWLVEHPAPACTTAEGPAAGAAAPSAPPQDSTAPTVDFKAWLGGEGGKPESEPASPPASRSATNSWSNAHDNLPSSSSVPRATSGIAGTSKPKPNMKVPPAPSAPTKASTAKPPQPVRPLSARQLTETDALRQIIITSFIVTIIHTACVIYGIICGNWPFLSCLLSSVVFFAFSIWTFHALKSADSMLQKVLIVIASGFLAFTMSHEFLYEVTLGNVEDFFFYLNAFVGPVGSLINHITAAPPKTSAAKLAQAAGLLAEEETLRKAFSASIVMAILEAAAVFYYHFAWAQQNDRMLWLLADCLYFGSCIYLFSVWALLAIKSAGSLWLRVLAVIAAGFLAFTVSPAILYAVTLENALDLIWYFINFAGPVGSIINFIAKKLRKK